MNEKEIEKLGKMIFKECENRNIDFWNNFARIILNLYYEKETPKTEQEVKLFFDKYVVD